MLIQVGLPVDGSLGLKVGGGAYNQMYHKCVLAMVNISHDRTPGLIDIKEHMILH